MTELRQRQPRERDNKYLEFVRTLPCCVCGRPAPSDAAHIRSGSEEHGKRPTGGGEKPADRFSVPLCPPLLGTPNIGCHARQHAYGDELAWWRSVGKDPFAISAKLYALGGGTATTARPKPAKIKSGKAKMPSRPFPSTKRKFGQ